MAAFVLHVARAHASSSDSARVVVFAAEDAADIVKEAVIRAQGELSAVGLTADVEVAAGARSGRSLPRGVYGMLELEQQGSVLIIHAWAPRAEQSLDARVDLAAAGVTAEVIAVRAVETLRAAMLEFTQSERGEVPGAVRGFTRFEPQRVPESIAEPAAPPSVAAPLAFWIGPALSLQAGSPPDLGAQLGALVGVGVGFAAAAVETTVSDVEVSASEGSASIARRALWAQLGVRYRPVPSWEVMTRAGIGYASFDITGEGEAGYRGRETTHGSLGLMLGVSGVYWATRGFGLYGGVGFRLATDAPTIRIAKIDVVTLDRPSFVASVGTSIGVF